MTPYYDHNGITIYHGDCREVLPHVGAFDVLLTDIPYGEVNRESGGLRNLDKGTADVETFDLPFVVECGRRATSVYVFCGTEQVSGLRAGFVASEMTTRLCVSSPLMCRVCQRPVLFGLLRLPPLRLETGH